MFRPIAIDFWEELASIPGVASIRIRFDSLRPFIILNYFLFFFLFYHKVNIIFTI